jgi:hypothetical protein
MVLRVDVSWAPPNRDEVRAGSERYEQPMDSDRKTKLQRRKARKGGGTVLCTDRFRARDLAKRGESQGGCEHTRRSYGPSQ